MKLVFENLIIDNFLSVGHADIDLPSRGYTLVKGVNNNPDDMAKSNGSGKSSIFEALVWCLTGETIRGVKDVVNMFSTGGTKVELTFRVDNDSYVITRYKDHAKFKTDLKIELNGQDISGKGIRDSQKILESHLPELTASLLGSVIVLGQGLPQRFTNNTPQGRKEVLEKLSKSDFMIEDLKQRLSDRKTSLNTLLRQQEDNVLSANTEIRTLTSQIETAQDRLSKLEDPSLYELWISRSKERICILESELEDFRQNLNTWKTELETLQASKSKIDASFQEQITSAKLNFSEITMKLRETRVEIESRIRQLNKEIRDAQSVKDTCPTCGRKFDGIFIPDVKEQEQEVTRLMNELNCIDSDLAAKQHEHNSVVSEIQQQQQKETQLIVNEISAARVHCQQFETGIAKTQGDISVEKSTLAKSESALSSYTATVDTLNQTIEDSKSQIDKLNTNLVYYNEKKSEIQDRLSVVTKFTTLTTRDFRGYLLKNVIKFIDSKAKEYCKDVFETENIDFVLDGNNIDIRYCGKQYEACSGGEKQKVDLIVQFAIRDMLCQFLDFSSSIIVLDEIFDNLDSVGCEKVINLISRKLSDIQSIFIITHHSDLQIPEDSTITVTKQQDGVSLVR